MCGIFGVFGVPNAAELTVLGLHVLQHRARETAGIASVDGESFFVHRGRGITRKVFKHPETLSMLSGASAIGQIRYSTSGEKEVKTKHVQPMFGQCGGQTFALVHNGNVINTEQFSHVETKSPIDTEYIVRLIEERGRYPFHADFCSVFKALKGSYSLGILFPGVLALIRDESGNRPLYYAKLGNGYAFSSETCAFSSVGANGACEVAPGTMVRFLPGFEPGVIRFAEANEHRCSFEHIYFSHPASTVFGERVIEFRKKLGRALEREAPAQADVVTAIPDSANFIAQGYAESGRSGSLEQLFFRNHYVGRTFVVPTQTRREIEVARKFIPDAEGIRGRRIVVVDDSIVRGTTLPQIVRTLRENGAAMVHVRIGSPPIEWPCVYGVDTPQKNQLVAAYKSPDEICKLVGADSLAYLSQEGLKAIYAEEKSKYCFACMDGKYWH